MKVVALISGGKDSCFNMMHVVAEGHEVVALANLYPEASNIDELDSYMYQTVGHEAIDLYSEAMDIPLFRRKIFGTSRMLDLDYIPDDKDEVEDLYELLKEIQQSVPFEAVSSGAILSDYQRIRVESVCSRLGLTSLSYLWRRNQEELLKNMLESGLEAVLIKTAALGLDPIKHLGKTLGEMSETLHSLNEKYGCHVCGEGGEFETFTLDCPLFKKKIVIDETEIIIHSDDEFARVGYLKLNKMHLEPKSLHEYKSEKWPLTTSSKWETKLASKLKCCKSKVKAISTLSGQDFWELPINTPARSEETVSCNGDFLIVSNLQGIINDEENGEVIENITLHVLQQLIAILHDHNHKQEDVCYVQINVSNIAHYKYINNVYSKFYRRNPPARACIGCINNAGNTSQKKLFQLYCISCKDHSGKKSMHVQGISHWAPANIGPFSQCVLLDNLLFVSGTVALVPGSMELIKGGAEMQAPIALHHVENVVLAMASIQLKNFLQIICYVTAPEDINYGVEAWKRAVCAEDAEESCKPLYLVVNELPRGALAEWQGIASVIKEDGEIASEKGCKICNDCSDVVRINWNYTSANNSRKKMYSFTLSLDQPDDDESKKDLMKCIKYIQECILHLLEKHNLKFDNIFQASLFYVGKSVTVDNVNGAWYENMKTISMPITPVQVNAISICGSYSLMCLTCTCLSFMNNTPE